MEVITKVFKTLKINRNSICPKGVTFLDELFALLVPGDFFPRDWSSLRSLQCCEGRPLLLGATGLYVSGCITRAFLHS